MTVPPLLDAGGPVKAGHFSSFPVSVCSWNLFKLPEERAGEECLQRPRHRTCLLNSSQCSIWSSQAKLRVASAALEIRPVLGTNSRRVTRRPLG